MRVNNREYSTDVAYESEDLARNAAATRAYMICRNFSVNDGMYPGQRPRGGVQGLPVAIGSGRRVGRKTNLPGLPLAEEDEREVTHVRHVGMMSAPDEETDSAGSTSSGGESPRSLDGEFDKERKRAMGAGSCFCRRADVHAYGLCELCLR